MGLGRGELRQGRTLDALQSAYRVGARVAWRRLARRGPAARASTPRCSACWPSRSSPTSRSSRPTRWRATRRRARSSRASAGGAGASWSRCCCATRRPTRPTCAPPPTAAGWRMPRIAAALACAESELDRLARAPAARRRSPRRCDGVGCVVIADPEGPGRARGDRRRRSRDLRAALGPAAPAAGLAGSWALARPALRAPRRAPLAEPTGAWLRADDGWRELLLFESRALVGAHRRAPARAARRALTPEGAARAWRRPRSPIVREQGNAAAMARALGRPRRRPRATGSPGCASCSATELDDPDARFELELALRARTQTVSPNDSRGLTT